MSVPAPHGATRPEAERIAGIQALAKLVNPANAKEMVDKIVRDGTTIEDARELLFEARVKDEEQTQIQSFSGGDRTFDNPKFLREQLAVALAATYSPRVTVTDPARQFMNFRPLEIAATCLEAQGQRMPRGTIRERIAMAAMHTTSDFPFLLADAANKMLLPEYTAAAPTYKQFCAPKTFNDFKAHKVLRLGDFPTLLEVGEGGEVKRGTISENKETLTMATYARMIAFSRQMLINDDLSAFADITMKAGRRVAMFENDLVFQQCLLLNSVGPTLSDGKVLFHTDHGNFQTTGTPVNRIPNLSAGRAAMRKQVGLDGLKLNLRPSILLVGPDNETAAQQVTAATAPQRATAVNPFSGTLTPVVDANIPDYAWMLFANPAEAPVIYAGSLAGQNGPMIAVKEGWDVLGVEFRVARDFGFGAVDYRGVYRDDGAAPVDEPVQT